MQHYPHGCYKSVTPILGRPAIRVRFLSGEMDMAEEVYREEGIMPLVKSLPCESHD